MPVHKVLHKTFIINGNEVFIKYWCDKSSVYVAAFDSSDKQVSAAKYQANVADIAKGFGQAFQMSLIDGLSATCENDLLTNPDLHYRP